jgi:hypothetical protein
MKRVFVCFWILVLSSGCSLILDSVRYRYVDTSDRRVPADHAIDADMSDGFWRADRLDPDGMTDAISLDLLDPPDANHEDVHDADAFAIDGRSDVYDVPLAMDAQDTYDVTDVRPPTDVARDVMSPDVVDVVDTGPNLIIRFTGTGATDLFLEAAPLMPLRLNLIRTDCVGGLRPSGSGVECLVSTPVSPGTEIRFNFARTSSYPTRPDLWICSGSGCPMFPDGYTVNYRGADVLPRTRFSLQLLPDGMGMNTYFIDLVVP